MILDDYVDIPIKNCRKLDYFESLGYDIFGDFIKLKVLDLNPGSRQLVNVKCDFCSRELKVTYKEYCRNVSKGNKYACSKNCGSLKAKESNVEKWGVEYPMMLENIQNKTKKTNLEKYGVEYLQQSKDIKEKSKRTIQERWGVDHISKTDYFKDKFKKTCLEKFGVEYPMISEEVKEKSKETSIRRFGVDNPSKSKEIQEIIKSNNLEKWGVVHPSKLDFIKLKVKISKLEKYGNENYNNIDKLKETISNFTEEDYQLIVSKIKKTKFERYNNEDYNNIDKIKETLSSFTEVDWLNINEKRKSTKLKKYGNENYNNIDKLKETISNFTEEDYKSIVNKIKKTKFERYNSEDYNNIDKIKETLSSFTEVDWNRIDKRRKNTTKEKYGVEHLFKDDKFRERFDLCNDLNYLRYVSHGYSLYHCDLGHEHDFSINSDNYFHRKKSNLPLCTVCFPIGDSVSIKEQELFDFISSIYSGEIVQSYRDGLEIDIYLPELKIGFEFNGLYWHSEEFKDKNYHIDKTNYFKERGIIIIHIWEDDWTFKKDIIKSQIKNWIGLNINKIYARDCQIKEITDIKLIKEFLSKNHIQGWVNSKFKIGLFFKNELVSLMTFDRTEGRKKMNDDDWNLNRFCNKLDYIIVGGASKLFNYFLKVKSPGKVISYADKDWSSGNLYLKLGFQVVYDSKPDYKYILDSKRIHKSRFRKSFTGISESKLSIQKIWDCGKIKFIYFFKTHHDS